MTIETQFDIGDAVTHKGREGIVFQVKADVQIAARELESEPIVAMEPFILYKVFFNGVFETRTESELSATD